MYLTKLVVNYRSREFRRDYADISCMHRTVMSGFPDLDTEEPARKHAAVLWRLDPAGATYVMYVQSALQPNYDQLPPGYLQQTAQTRTLEPVLEAAVIGRRLAFRLQANPTRSLLSVGGGTGPRRRGKVTALRELPDQIDWLQSQGQRRGFVVPEGSNSQPDVTAVPGMMLTGTRREQQRRQITIYPVRFDGHLVVTDSDAFTAALREGVGRGKAYGCGLLSLAPPRAA